MLGLDQPRAIGAGNDQDRRLARQHRRAEQCPSGRRCARRLGCGHWRRYRPPPRPPWQRNPRCTCTGHRSPAIRSISNSSRRPAGSILLKSSGLFSPPHVLHQQDHQHGHRDQRQPGGHARHVLNPLQTDQGRHDHEHGRNDSVRQRRALASPGRRSDRRLARCQSTSQRIFDTKKAFTRQPAELQQRP